MFHMKWISHNLIMKIKTQKKTLHMKTTIFFSYIQSHQKEERDSFKSLALNLFLINSIQFIKSLFYFRILFYKLLSRCIHIVFLQSLSLFSNTLRLFITIRFFFPLTYSNSYFQRMRVFVAISLCVISFCFVKSTFCSLEYSTESEETTNAFVHSMIRIN